MDFAARIKERRLELKLTLAEVGKFAGLSPQTVGRTELGQSMPGPASRQRLCDALELHPATLRPLDTTETVVINVSDAFEERLIELAVHTIANAPADIAYEWWHLLIKQGFSADYWAQRDRFAREGGLHAGLEYARDKKIPDRIVTRFKVRGEAQ